jgi:hypothetical protein
MDRPIVRGLVERTNTYQGTVVLVSALGELGLDGLLIVQLLHVVAQRQLHHVPVRQVPQLRVRPHQILLSLVRLLRHRDNGVRSD